MIPNPDEPNLVEPTDGCPLCAERRADRLEWNQDGEKVTCSMCGTQYIPQAKER